jgi:MinD-like ATPase involved in chromosome partitioning or flagellar assembly
MNVGEHIVPDRVGARAGHPSRITVLAEEPSGVSISGADNRVASETESSVDRGRLLAVCGLCGGAGASTLAYLVALAAARSHPDSVLVADTGGPTGGLSGYAGVETPRSIAELSEYLVAGPPTEPAVAAGSDGVRVLATGPRFTAECAPDGIGLLLDQARECYALTVIDCGTLASDADRVALARASHVAWVLPATVSGLHRAGRVLDAITLHVPRDEVLVARHQGHARKAPLKELRQLARHRSATLVLLPTLPDIAVGDADAALDAAQVSLQAIQGVLAR